MHRVGSFSFSLVYLPIKAPTHEQNNLNKAIRDGRPRPPRHQVGWDIVTRECACQISWWSVEKWRRYYILKFRWNTFRWPMTLTFDLKFWKYLSVTVYPYVICMPSFIMIGWEMAEILHFEILRKHGQTNTQTHKQTDMGITIPRPPPMGGEVIIQTQQNILYAMICIPTLTFVEFQIPMLKFQTPTFKFQWDWPMLKFQTPMLKFSSCCKRRRDVAQTARYIQTRYPVIMFGNDFLTPLWFQSDTTLHQ